MDDTTRRIPPARNRRRPIPFKNDCPQFLYVYIIHPILAKEVISIIKFFWKKPNTIVAIKSAAKTMIYVFPSPLLTLLELISIMMDSPLHVPLFFINAETNAKILPASTPICPMFNFPLVSFGLSIVSTFSFTAVFSFGGVLP